MTTKHWSSSPRHFRSNRFGHINQLYVMWSSQWGSANRYLCQKDTISFSVRYKGVPRGEAALQWLQSSQCKGNNYSGIYISDETRDSTSFWRGISIKPRVPLSISHSPLVFISARASWSRSIQCVLLRLPYEFVDTFLCLCHHHLSSHSIFSYYPRSGGDDDDLILW